MKKPQQLKAQANTQRPLKLIQFGTGNFLRGFVDWMVDILNEKTDFDGSVHLVQTKGKMIPASFVAQDCRYHVWIRGLENGETIDELRLITAISGISNAEADYGGFLELASSPDLTLIVSNATEAGVYVDPSDKDLETCPKAFPGKLTAFLYARFLYLAGDPSFRLIVLPCELIANNGDTLKSMVLQYAKRWGLSPKFDAWLDASCHFCNTLVDRIVPGFPSENQSELGNQTAFRDDWAVVAEPYHLWAIRGPEFLMEIFQTEKTGLNVHIVKDLADFHTKKVRILNGAHTAMVPMAYLAGLRTVREAVEDADLGKIIREIVFDEIIPSMDLSEEALKEYAASVFDRFRNPFIRHELISISLNSISKFRVRVLPSLLSYQEKFGKLPPHLLRSFAALIYFYSGKTSQEPIPLKDEPKVIQFFEDAWMLDNAERMVDFVLGQGDFWGRDLREIPDLLEGLVKELELLKG